MMALKRLHQILATTSHCPCFVLHMPHLCNQHIHKQRHQLCLLRHPSPPKGKPPRSQSLQLPFNFYLQLVSRPHSLLVQLWLNILGPPALPSAPSATFGIEGSFFLCSSVQMLIPVPQYSRPPAHPVFKQDRCSGDPNYPQQSAF